MINLWESFFWQVEEEPPKEETKKVGVRFAPEPEMEDIQTKTEVRMIHHWTAYSATTRTGPDLDLRVNQSERYLRSKDSDLKINQ